MTKTGNVCRWTRKFVGLVLCCRFDELTFDSLQSDFSNFLLFCVSYRPTCEWCFLKNADASMHVSRYLTEYITIYIETEKPGILFFYYLPSDNKKHQNSSACDDKVKAGNLKLNHLKKEQLISATTKYLPFERMLDYFSKSRKLILQICNTSKTEKIRGKTQSCSVATMIRLFNSYSKCPTLSLQNHMQRHSLVIITMMRKVTM